MTKMLTNQEVFDKVAAHLLTQRKKSFLRPKVCAYRSPEGLKCALGIFIPDDVYESSMEGKGPRRLFAHWPSTMTSAGLHSGKTNFLYDLQNVHDQYDPWEWARTLRSKAKFHGLDASIVDKFPPIEGPG